MSFKKPTITTDHRMEQGVTAIEVQSNGAFAWFLDGKRIRRFHSLAAVADGRRIDTRTARRIYIREAAADTVWGKGNTLYVTYTENGLELEQRLTLFPEKRELIASAALHDTQKETETNFIAPLDNPYPDADEDLLFRSLDQRMLLTPYDNDMWVRWEATPLRPGRTSYDVSALFDEKSRKGMVLGAVDHDVWKNAVACSAWDARCVMAYSGVADAATHDSMPHGTLVGEWVESARFMVGWYGDVRDGLEIFADYCAAKRTALAWDRVPFGWNSFSGVGRTTLESWEVAADLLDALPNFNDEEGVTYANLDASFGLDPEKRVALVKKYHARGQKCGTYGGPFLYHRLFAQIAGRSGLPFEEMLLRDKLGRTLPTIDGSMALDCTHPAWEQYARTLIRTAAEEGFDYLKIDFLAHGACEGVRYNKSIRTGRQAYTYGMRILVDELQKADHPMFLSLSIAPLFPFGYGHARRCCCDSFGHTEDVRYVLNALNFGWWTNRKLYAFNDPDHIALYNSVIDGRPTTEFAEARSRYNAAVISGTVMLLSDNYGPDGDPELMRKSRERAEALATNGPLNAIARSKVAFRPVELSGDTTALYTAAINGKHYAAFFNFARTPAALSLEALRGDLPVTGHAHDLNRGTDWDYSSVLTVALDPMDSAIIEID